MVKPHPHFRIQIHRIIVVNSHVAAIDGQDFKPKLFYWRLLLIFRKFWLVAVAVLLNHSPMIQASASILVLFIAYSMHATYQPFLLPQDLATSFKTRKLTKNRSRVCLCCADILDINCIYRFEWDPAF